jgi:hypothetical protein
VLADLRSVTGDLAEARLLLDEALTLRRRIMPASHQALAAAERQMTDLERASQ